MSAAASKKVEMMTRAYSIPCFMLLALVLGSAASACKKHGASQPVAKDPDAKEPDASLSKRLSECPGAADSATQTLATLNCFNEACEAGEMRGCSYLASYYFAGKIVAVDTKRGVELAQRACDGNEGLGCLLASSYYMGFAVSGGGEAPDDVKPIDAAKAVRFAERSCELSVAEGCGMAGGAYFSGSGAPVDKPRAKALLKRGCDLGHDVSCKGLQKISTP